MVNGHAKFANLAPSTGLEELDEQEIGNAKINFTGKIKILVAVIYRLITD